jgi:hypothetical protein
MPQPAANKFFGNLTRSLGPDERKYAILGTLLLLLGLLIVRQVSNSGPPAPASASRVPAGDNPTLSNGAAAGEISRGLRAGTPKSTAAGESPVARWLSSPPATFGRNPFAVKLDLFPADATKFQSVRENGGFWDEVAKSLLDQADQQERKQEMLSSLQAQARALRVTSVLMGSRPRAVINGELVGEGDVVAGFRVLEIEPRRIVVEREGIRLEVTMH